MPMVIDLQVTNKDTDKVLTRLEKALQRLEDAQKRLNESLSDTAQNANAAATAFGKMTTSARSAASATKAVKSNPASVRASLASAPSLAYQRANLRNNPEEARRVATNVLSQDPYNPRALSLYHSAQALIEKQNRPLPNPVVQALMRTRWTQVGGKTIGSPLGVDMLRMQDMGLGSMFGGIDGAAAGAAGANGAAGASGAAGAAGASISMLAVGVSAAVGVVVLSLVAMAKAFDTVRNSFNSFSKESIASSNDPHTVALMQPFARMLGADVGSLSGRLQGGLQSGYGMAIGTRLGINPVGGMFGDNDYAGKLKKTLNFIASLNPKQARGVAESLGIPEAARLAYLNPGQKSQMIGTLSSGPGEGVIATSTQIEFTVARATTLLDKFLTVFKPILDAFNTVVTGLLQRIELVLAIVQSVMKALHLDDTPGVKATKENTKAIDQNTQAVNQWTVNGAGARASAGIPGGYRNNGFALDRDTMANVRLGYQ